MSIDEAVIILMDLAARYGENAEEIFIHRVKDTDDDETCIELAEQSQVQADEVIEIRDLWKAVQVAKEFLEQRERQRSDEAIDTGVGLDRD